MISLNIRKNIKQTSNKLLKYFGKIIKIPILMVLGLSPLFTTTISLAAGSGGQGQNAQGNILIHPITPNGGETIRGSYLITATASVDPSQVTSLQYCLRPGEEPTDIVSLEAGTDAECVWANMAYNAVGGDYTATIDTTTYTDGLYTMPFLLKASGVPGQKYTFVKGLIINNNPVNSNPVVSLQTVNVTFPDRPTSMPLRGTIDVQGKIVDTDIASHQLTITDSTGTVVYDTGVVNNSNEMPAYSTMYTWDTTLVPDGAYTITLTARDLANNIATTTIDRTVDNSHTTDGGGNEGSAVAILPVQPLEGDFIGGIGYLVQVKVTNPTIQFDSMMMRLQSSGGGSPGSSSAPETTTDESSPWFRMYFNDQTGNWEYVLDTTQYVTGNVYWLHVRAENDNGDIVTDSVAALRVLNLTVDNSSPIVSAGPDITTGQIFSRTGTFSDNFNSMKNVQWSKVSGPGNITFSNQNSLTTNISADLNGAYVIKLSAADLAGNTAESTFNLTWYIPVQTPTTPTTPTTSTTPTSVSTTPVVNTTLTTTTPVPDSVVSADLLGSTLTPTDVTTASTEPLLNTQADLKTSNPDQTLSVKNTNWKWLWIPVLIILLGTLLTYLFINFSKKKVE